MTRLTFDPVFGSYFLVVVAAMTSMGLLALGPGRNRVTSAKRSTLAALRAATIALLLAALLRPTLVYTETVKQSATLVILADQSRSMSVRDGIGGKSRWDVLRGTVRDAESELEELAQDFELVVYTFDAEARPAEIDGGKILLGDTPDGEQTAIGWVLEDVLGREAGKRLLGVVLLSDGAQRAYAPRERSPRTAVGLLKPMGTPLFTFAFGQSMGLGQVQDVAVAELLVNQTVFEKNELAVAGQVRADGYANRQIPVRLLFETAPGRMEEVAIEKLTAAADGRPLPVMMAHTPQTSGEFKLTLEAAEQPGELATTNNRLSTFVNVIKGGLSVLYLEGTYRVEAVFLQRALNASPDVNVRYNRIDAEHLETRPGDLAECLQPGKFDVYVLGDLDSTAFKPDELAGLAKAVDQGAGLIMLGGVHSFGPGGYAGTPLADVLPVTTEPNERQRFGDPVRADVHLPGPLQMRPTRLGLLYFPLTLAGSRQQNEALWAGLPPLEGANRFSPARLAPGALVRADAGPNAPLMVDHYYGDGRVIAFAADSTWRWWMRGHQEAHKRFWRQVILWLAKKDQSTDRVWVRLAKRRFAPAENVEIAVGAQSAAGEPIADARFDAKVVLPDGKQRQLTLVAQDGQFSGSFSDTKLPGDYAIEVTATQQGALLGEARARFLVFQQDLELDNAAADADALQRLAAMTGGQSLAPEQLPELIRRLAENTEALEIEQETKEPFWDTWPFFLALVGLLGTEWYLRKRWRLV